jgi:FkbH-like protein
MHLPELSELIKCAKQAPEKPTTSLRVALLADTATQLLAAALKGSMHRAGASIELFPGEFDQIEMQVLDPTSEMHAFAPNVVVIYLAGEKIGASYGQKSVEVRRGFAADFIERAQRLHAALGESKCETVFFNLVDPGDAVFGSYGNKVDWSLQTQIRQCNVELGRYATAHADFHIYDLGGLQAELGRTGLFDPKLYFTSKIAIRPDALPRVGRDLAALLLARKGSFLKCLILDLDNTLWGGVIADDGMERIQIGDLGLGPAFTALQSWLRQMRDRGIVLAVCSKNDDANAREPFLKHPDMVLRLDDIAVFVANWQDKATNIRHIKRIVDVDYGAMAFLDDNPAERALVRESFPALRVPEMPEDPSEYVSYLQSLNLMEAGSYTAGDAKRTIEYQAEVKRHEAKEKFVDPGAFLQSLEMRAKVSPFEPFNFPRIAQLTQRSNQFNLRTARYSEKQVEELALSPLHETLTIELRDRFGDNGLISVVILDRQAESFFIDTWLMSCRVLGRGVEQFVLNTLVEKARASGVTQLVGEYLETAKNGMVREHYPKLGFVPLTPGRWTLEVADFQPFPVSIAAEASVDEAVPA